MSAGTDMLTKAHIVGYCRIVLYRAPKQLKKSLMSMGTTYLPNCGSTFWACHVEIMTAGKPSKHSGEEEWLGPDVERESDFNKCWRLCTTETLQKHGRIHVLTRV